MLYALLTFFFWWLADLYYKKGNTEDSKYDHLKTGIIVGLVMGIHATLYLLINKVDVNVIDIIKYLPVSMCYILSMIIGYRGLKYIELSISSPVQNSSGIITSLLLVVIFKVLLSKMEILGIIIVFIGVLVLSLTEMKENSKEKIVSRLKVQAIMFPLMYALIDGTGTFLDAIYLEHLNLISEDMALVAYEYTFLIYGLVIFMYLQLVSIQLLLFQLLPVIVLYQYCYQEYF